uniref:Uncharacterized protein LOC111110732 n=1 Tax=Crassostrea virginica TaxID=6565 RepID=A0A8B8BJB4_CRAVI|nr:uncharacterized protein LOC111110732 [Crassostrea virginica]
MFIFEPPGKRFRSSSDQTVSQKTRTTPTIDRVALLSQANRFLSDEQINQFITSTVLRHQHKSSGSQSSVPKHIEAPNHTPKQTSACPFKELNSLAVIQVSPQSNNVSQTDSVMQTGVKNVPKETTSPQQSLVPHRNITVSQGKNATETKTLNPIGSQITSVSQENNEETVLQQNHTTNGLCNKGLVDPQSACELSLQKTTSNEGSAGYMQKDEVTNTGSQSVPERPVQNVTTNEKLVPSQKTACNSQPNKGYKKMYEEPKGQRRRKFSRKCKRKGKNSQQGKPQQKARETAVESPSSGSQSEGETESGENDSLEDDEDVNHMTPEELFEDFMEKIKSAAKDTDTSRDHYRDLYMFPWISPHQSLFDNGILIPCENFYLDLNLLQ